MDYLFQDKQGKWLGTILVLVLLWALFRIILFLINRNVANLRLRAVWRQSVRFSLLGVALIIIIQIWFERFSSVFTVLSLIAAALTIVSKELLLNLIGWVVIMWRSLFTIGDRITVQEHTGDVISTGVLYFTLGEITPGSNLKNLSGRIVKVPNSAVLTHTIVNHSQGFNFVWNEIEIALTLDSDWKRAEQILREIITEHHENIGPEELAALRDSEQGLIYRQFEPEITLRLRPGKILLFGRYMCKPYKVHESENSIWRAIVERFDNYERIKVANLGVE